MRTKLFTLCSVTNAPLRNRYEELGDEDNDEEMSAQTTDEPEVSPGSARNEGLAGRRRRRESVFTEVSVPASDEPNEQQEMKGPPELVDSDDENANGTTSEKK